MPKAWPIEKNEMLTFLDILWISIPIFLSLWIITAFLRSQNKEQIKSLSDMAQETLETITKTLMEHNRRAITTLTTQTEMLNNSAKAYSAEISLLTSYITELAKATNSIQSDLNNLIHSIEKLSTNIQTRTLKEFDEINKTLTKVGQEFSVLSRTFQDQIQQGTLLLKGLGSVPQLIEDIDTNVKKLTIFNESADHIVESHKNILMELHIISNHLDELSTTKFQPMVEELTNALPQIQERSQKLAEGVYSEFKEAILRLDEVAKDFNGIARAYTGILEGRKIDPLTGSFMSIPQEIPPPPIKLAE